MTAIAFAVSATAATAVVFVEDPGASPGQALYGQLGSDVGTSNVYNVYRKGGVPDVPGLPVAADNGDGTATWTNLTHGGAVSCCGDQGMFFGQAPSTTSYKDSVLKLRSTIDTASPQFFDTNGRRQFDLRFGFIESEADFLDGKGANNGTFDLWTADHGSDSIYIGMNIGSTNGSASAGDTPIEGALNEVVGTTPHDNHFVRIGAYLRGQAKELSAGATIVDERERNRWIGDANTSAQHVDNTMSQKPTAIDISQPGLVMDITGSGANSDFDTGVGYDDDLAVEWWMELNDPGNADPVLGREVKFNFQAGNLIVSQVFDPGSAAEPMVPNPTHDAGQAFDGGFFDWQNAVPMLFMAPQGGAISGDGSVTSTIAFEDQSPPGAPADLNNDGFVDGLDLGIQLGNFDTVADASGGELNGTPPVDGLDLGILLGAWNPPALGAKSVPEPSTAVLLCGLAIGLLGSRRQR